MSLTLAAILAAARTTRPEPTCSICGERDPNIPCSCAGREAVKELCAGLTDADLRAEIERLGEEARRGATLAVFAPTWGQIAAREADARRLARDVLQTERDRRSHEAAIATLPEERR